MPITVAPVVIGALGSVPLDLSKWLKVKCSNFSDSLQGSQLLHTAIWEFWNLFSFTTSRMI